MNFKNVIQTLASITYFKPLVLHLIVSHITASLLLKMIEQSDSQLESLYFCAINFRGKKMSGVVLKNILLW